MIQQTAHEWRCTTSSPAAKWPTCLPPARLARCARCFALHLRALERQRLPTTQKRGIPLPCARAPQSGYGSHRRLFSPPRQSTPPAIVATVPTTGLADVFVAHGQNGLTGSPKRAVGRRARSRTQTAACSTAKPDNALTAAADFIDLKCPTWRPQPQMRRPEREAARLLAYPDDAVTTVRRAAQVHDFGATGVSNSILDKRGRSPAPSSIALSFTPCSRSRCFRRSAASPTLKPVASAHHESATAPAITRASRDHGDPAPASLPQLKSILE